MNLTDPRSPELEKLLVGFFQLAIINCRVPGDDGMSIAEFARRGRGADLLHHGKGLT